MKRWYVGDVMSVEVVTVSAATGYKAVADLLVQRSVSAVPVVDATGFVLGVVSEADLLPKLEYADRVLRHPLSAQRMRDRTRKAAGGVAGELMTAPPVTIRATETVTRAARLMDVAGIKRLLVVDDGGRLVGIVSRRDLLRPYTTPDSQIRVAIADGVLKSLRIDQSTLDIRVVDGVVTLTGHVERRSTATLVVAFTLGTAGVVDVVDRLTYEIDDAPRDTHAHPLHADREDVDIG